MNTFFVGGKVPVSEYWSIKYTGKVRSQRNVVGLREKVNFPKALALVNKGVDYHSGGSELVPFGGALPNIFLTAQSGVKISQ